LASHFTVYLIDDNNWHIELLRSMLDDEAFDLTHWSSPRDAWNGINSYPSPDLVILDLDPEQQLNSTIGFADLLDHLRMHWNRVPVILLSESPNPEIVKRGKALGIEAFVSKPYDIRYLLETVYRALRGVLSAHITALNRQHVELRRNFQRLQNADRVKDLEIEKLLQALARHFRFEESFMTAHHYPKLAPHSEAHAQLLGRANKLLRPRHRQSDAVERVWRGITSDINDDSDYIEFLEAIREELESRLATTTAP
jgi:response regulator RpfG family c-di-GMP phosphodiesterase